MIKPEYANAPTKRRLLMSLLLIVSVFAIGTFGYYFLGNGRWSIGDCAYMTIISLSTVGFGETLEGMNAVPYARLFTALLLISGASVALYAVSMMTTFLVEGEFFNIRRRRRMDKRIEALHDHLIVCGAGRSGMHVIEELITSHWHFVVVDINPNVGDQCQEILEESVDYIVGNAIDDHVLQMAGIERAYGVIAALPEDKDNLFVVLSSRVLNPKLRIIAKAVDARAVNKLKVAGADSVVSVNQIGGMRLASEMIRPKVVTFIDSMLRNKDKNLRFEELTIPPGSPLVGRRLADSDIRKERKLLVVAVTGGQSGDIYAYSPGPDFRLEEGMTLVMIGETNCVARLRESPLFAHHS